MVCSIITLAQSTAGFSYVMKAIKIRLQSRGRALIIDPNARSPAKGEEEGHAGQETFSLKLVELYHPTNHPDEESRTDNSTFARFAFQPISENCTGYDESHISKHFLRSEAPFSPMALDPSLYYMHFQGNRIRACEHVYGIQLIQCIILANRADICPMIIFVPRGRTTRMVARCVERPYVR
jgi:hypothetical protein